jgi:hypothetical protein
MKSDNILHFLPMLYYFINTLFTVGWIKLTLKQLHRTLDVSLRVTYFTVFLRVSAKDMAAVTRHVQFVSVLPTSQSPLTGNQFATSLEFKMTPQRQYCNTSKGFNTSSREEAQNSTHHKQIKRNWHTRYIPLSRRHYPHDCDKKTEVKEGKGWSCCPLPYTCFHTSLSAPISLEGDIYWSNLVQLFSVAYWRKKINQYVNIFVTNIIWAFMCIYTTTRVIKKLNWNS